MQSSGTQQSEISEASRRMAARTGSSALSLVVAGAEDINGSMRRMRLCSDALSTVAFEPGQDLMFSVPAGDRTVRRRYTIRRLDRAAGAVDVDIVRHGDGPGARWASSAEVGDRIEAVGPRGKVILDADAGWHLFVGDESFSPAAFAMAEVVPAGQRRTLVIEVDSPADHSEPPDGGGAEAVWVYRRGRLPGSGDPLVDAVRTVDLPDGPGHVYLGGEAATVSAVKAVLIDRGVPADAISAKAYWRLGNANAEHGEPHR